MFLGLYALASPNLSFRGGPAGSSPTEPELLDLSFLSLLDFGASRFLGFDTGDASSIGSLLANLESAILQSGRSLCCGARKLAVGRVRLL